jgi:hypothetical protein
MKREGREGATNLGRRSTQHAAKLKPERTCDVRARDLAAREAGRHIRRPARAHACMAARAPGLVA